MSSASSLPLAFNAGKLPTTPLLHCATHKSGLLTMNKGAPKAGSLSFARSWAATVFMAIFATVSECTRRECTVVTCCAVSTTANRWRAQLRTTAARRWRQLWGVDRLLQAVSVQNVCTHFLLVSLLPLVNGTRSIFRVPRKSGQDTSGERTPVDNLPPGRRRISTAPIETSAFISMSSGVKFTTGWPASVRGEARSCGITNVGKTPRTSAGVPPYLPGAGSNESSGRCPRSTRHHAVEET